MKKNMRNNEDNPEVLVNSGCMKCEGHKWCKEKEFWKMFEESNVDAIGLNKTKWKGKVKREAELCGRL